MSTLSLIIVVVFVIGYMFIALESTTKVNKAAVALLMCVACWSIYMIGVGEYVNNRLDFFPALREDDGGVIAMVGKILKVHLGGTAETLFFLWAR